VAFAARSVGRSGLVAGTLLGTLLWCLAGWRGWCLLGAFFVLGSGLTKFGAREKEARGIAEAAGGRRGARNAIAKVAPGLLVAIIGIILAAPEVFWHVAFAATFATAAADTAGTEVGKAIGRTPILLTTFRRVAPGTIGAVSVEGTVAGLLAAAAIAGLGASLGFYTTAIDPWIGALVVVAAAFAGNVFESWTNAFLANRRKLDHDLSNFLLCSVGGAVAALLTRAIL
jgi:uncharacterized protein (TIGR00297 family)